MLINEKLLQYIWQFQYFNGSELSTGTGERLQVLHPGQLNRHQGPDFSNALIRIDSTILAGSIEIHLKTSLWKTHGHEGDPNYRSVILHVVYEHDEEAHPLPILELKDRIPRLLLGHYEMLMNSQGFIPCSTQLSKLSPLRWVGWKDRLLASRLDRKASRINEYLLQNSNNWNEVLWWMLARNLGHAVNSDSFEYIARSLPSTLITRHSYSIQQLEALLMGQAGLLEQPINDEYGKLLQREYAFLRRKYGLNRINHPVHFLRMRPQNFPTVRLAQLAALVAAGQPRFGALIETETLGELELQFAVVANDYWHYHYRFDEEGSFRPKKLGRGMFSNLVINTLVPLVYAYGKQQKLEGLGEKALRWLEELPAEKNSTLGAFFAEGVSCGHAGESQALLELKTEYCNTRKCLQCAVGNAILGST